MLLMVVVLFVMNMATIVACVVLFYECGNWKELCTNWCRRSSTPCTIDLHHTSRRSDAPAAGDQRARMSCAGGL